jgi:hypothetical protein
VKVVLVIFLVLAPVDGAQLEDPGHAVGTGLAARQRRLDGRPLRLGVRRRRVRRQREKGRAQLGILGRQAEEGGRAPLAADASEGRRVAHGGRHDVCLVKVCMW